MLLKHRIATWARFVHVALMGTAALTFAVASTQTHAAANYVALADELQNSTHSQFISPNGTYYEQDNGTQTRFHYWWNSNGLDALADAYLRTRSATYATRMKTLLRGIQSNNGGTYRNAFYDDMEWLGNASLRAFELTGDTEYLTVAQQMWAEVKVGYSSGMFTWNTGCHPSCKNTIANTGAIILGARLYQRSANAADLTILNTAYNNIKARAVDPASGAVWDAYNPTTGAIDKATYSYNQGMWIGAALEMYKIHGAQSYMDDAIKTANYVMNQRRTNGMFFLAATGGGDGGLFNGILVRYLALFAREGNISATLRTQINDAIKFNADTLSTHIRRPPGVVGTNWTVTPGTVTDYSTQLSGLFLFEAAAILDWPMVYDDYYYNGRPAVLPPGSYNLAALNARGIADNIITSFTAPPGSTLTLYENNNFTGASAVRTGNDTLLIDEGWNDRTTSLVSASTSAPVGVTFYQDSNYGGAASALLGKGNYGVLPASVPNDWMSSLRVPSGWVVDAYANGNFTGAVCTFTADTSWVGSACNDVMSSFRIR
jgi:predicted alpha-1,6-mannanase (GH76 family)